MASVFPASPAASDLCESFLAAGFDGYLEKPISVLQLPEQVRGFCRP